MVKDNETVTVGAVRELTDDEIKARELGKGLPASGANFEGDQAKQLHKVAVEISKLGDDSKLFETSDIATPVLGQVEDTIETVTTKTSTPRSVVKGEKEVLTKVKLLVDWHDGQGILHPHGEEIELVSNEATRLLNERRAQRVDPPADVEDPGKHLMDPASKETAAEKAEKAAAAAKK